MQECPECKEPISRPAVEHGCSNDAAERSATKSVKVYIFKSEQTNFICKE